MWSFIAGWLVVLFAGQLLVGKHINGPERKSLTNYTTWVKAKVFLLCFNVYYYIYR